MEWDWISGWSSTNRAIRFPARVDGTVAICPISRRNWSKEISEFGFAIFAFREAGTVFLSQIKNLKSKIAIHHATLKGPSQTWPDDRTSDLDASQSRDVANQLTRGAHRYDCAQGQRIEAVRRAGHHALSPRAESQR